MYSYVIKLFFYCVVVDGNLSTDTVGQNLQNIVS